MGGTEASAGIASVSSSKNPKGPLGGQEYERYGRQMIVPGFGLNSQLKLKDSKVLVVGAGGLGCPLLLYLVGSGIGSITIVDGDTVSLSNLHRQVLHTVLTIGMNKAESACQYLSKLNPNVTVIPIPHRLTPSLIRSSSSSSSSNLDFSSYTLLIDCSDNPSTRYLLSDISVYHSIPLLSGAAIGTEGWVVRWNDPVSIGPCYRCVFPEKEEEEEEEGGGKSGRCEDEGVLGNVTGTIGTLMAGEVIKMLTKNKRWKFYGDENEKEKEEECKGIMLLFSFDWKEDVGKNPFRSIKLRGRKKGCKGCGEEGKKEWWMDEEECNKRWKDDVEWCGIQEKEGDERISAKDLQILLSSNNQSPSSFENKITIIDVRPPTELSICSIEPCKNIPLQKFLKSPRHHLTSLLSSSSSSSPSTSNHLLPTDDQKSSPDQNQYKFEPNLTNRIKDSNQIEIENEKYFDDDDSNLEIHDFIFICRRGNDSLIASRKLKSSLLPSSSPSSNHSSSPFIFLQKPQSIILNTTDTTACIANDKDQNQRKIDVQTDNVVKSHGIRIRDLRGGLVAWSKLNEGFPVY